MPLSCDHLFTMKRLLTLAVFSLALAACVDTTGLTPDLTNSVHPSSNANAAVVVVEYADLQCPACKDAHVKIVQPLLQQYGSQIRYEYHHMPLASIHPYAVEAAEAAECAAEQGKFWEFIDHNFEHQEELSTSAITEWGKALGLDEDLFMRCRKSHIKRDAIQASYDAGRALGVSGTPTFFVNGTLVESSLDALGAAIRQAQDQAQMML